MLLSCAFLPSSPLLLPGLAPRVDAQLELIVETMKAVARDIALLRPTTLFVITDGEAAYQDAFALDVADPYTVSFSAFGHLGATATYHPDFTVTDALQREARRRELPLTLHTEKILAPHCAVALEFFKNIVPHCKIVPLYVARQRTAKEHVACGEVIRHVIEGVSARVSVLALGDVAPHLLTMLRPIVKEKQLPQLMTFLEDRWDTQESFSLRQLAILFGILSGTEVYASTLESAVLFDEVGCLVAEFPLR